MCNLEFQNEKKKEKKYLNNGGELCKLDLKKMNPQFKNLKKPHVG